MKKKSILLIIVLALLVVLYLVFAAGQKNDEPVVEKSGNVVDEAMEAAPISGEFINEEITPIDGEFTEGFAEGEFTSETDGEAVFCTMDAMECPDGSFVGRIAPNCEFAACPIPGIAQPELVYDEFFAEEETIPAMFE